MSAGEHVSGWSELQAWPDANLVTCAANCKFTCWTMWQIAAIRLSAGSTSAQFTTYDVSADEWETEWREIDLPQPHRAKVHQISVAAERGSLFVNTRRGGIFEWDVKTGKHYLTIESEFTGGARIAWVHGGLHVLQYKTRKHSVWACSSTWSLQTKSRVPMHGYGFRLVSVAQRQLLVGINPTTGEIYVYSTGRRQWDSTCLYLPIQTGNAGSDWHCASSPCGRYVVFVRVDARCGDDTHSSPIRILDLGEQSDASRLKLCCSTLCLPRCTNACQTPCSFDCRIACICIAHSGLSRKECEHVFENMYRGHKCSGVDGIVVNAAPSVIVGLVDAFVGNKGAGRVGRLHVVWRNGSHWAVTLDQFLRDRTRARSSHTTRAARRG